jgi:Sap, sulfolipid-1-addressing protein
LAWPLLAGIAGLALLDSLNPATIAAVALVLLLAQHRPVLSAVAVAAGAYLTVLGVGLVLFFSAGAAAEAVNGVVVGLRFVAFGLAGISLIVTGVRRLSDRPRKQIGLPDWFSPATAIGLGAGMTAADLPNAFPYFIAIERLLNAEVSGLTGVAVIAGYAAVYCLPCLVLVVIGSVAHDKVRGRLQKLVTRFTTGVVKRSVPIAVGSMVAGVVVAAVPFFL